MKEKTMNENIELASALAKRLARGDVNDELVLAATKRATAVATEPIDARICQYGICLDYYVKRDDLSGLIETIGKSNEIGGIKIFPKGIINPDMFLVEVDHVISRRG